MPPRERGEAVPKPQATPGVSYWLPLMPTALRIPQTLKNQYPPMATPPFLPFLLPLEGKEG
jgi:hypothetical protein